MENNKRKLRMIDPQSINMDKKEVECILVESNKRIKTSKLVVPSGDSILGTNIPNFLFLHLISFCSNESLLNLMLSNKLHHSKISHSQLFCVRKFCSYLSDISSGPPHSLEDFLLGIYFRFDVLDMAIKTFFCFQDNEELLSRVITNSNHFLHSFIPKTINPEKFKEKREKFMMDDSCLNDTAYYATMYLTSLCSQGPLKSDLFKILLDHKADPNKTGVIGSDASAFSELCGNYNATPKKIKMMLLARADPNLYEPKRGGDMGTPFQIACKNKFMSAQLGGKGEEVIRMMLENGADPNFSDGHCQSPFSIYLDGDITAETFEMMLRFGVDIKDIPDRALVKLCAAPDINLDILKTVKKRYPDEEMMLINDVNQHELITMTPIDSLCKNKNITSDILEFLINNFGFLPNFRDADNKTALHHLACNQAVTKNLLKILVITCDFSPVLKDNNDMNVMHHLAQNKSINQEMLKFCLKSNPFGRGTLNRLFWMRDLSGMNFFHYLCENEKCGVETLRPFRMTEEEINYENLSCKTGLHFLVENPTSRRRDDKIQYLLEQKANPNLADHEGESPFWKFCGRQGISGKVLESFIASGANVNLEHQVSSIYKNPFANFFHNGECTCKNLEIFLGTKIVEIEIINKVFYNTLCCARFTPIDPKLLGLLLDFKADPNTIDPKKFFLGTAFILMIDASEYFCETSDLGDSTPFDELIVKSLGMGASPNDSGSEGKTAFHYLCMREKCSHALLSIFLESGADCNIEDDYGSTPFDYLLENKECSESKIDLFLNYIYANKKATQKLIKKLSVLRNTQCYPEKISLSEEVQEDDDDDSNSFDNIKNISNEEEEEEESES